MTTAIQDSAGAFADLIGPYSLIQKVGEGGMGEVWLAEQTRPLYRKVALKLIKAGMDTKQVIARFEAERQALALMDHPAIAKVYEAGETPRGLPYFAMEYVAGEPITLYCDRHRLSMPERLTLFALVCEGVQHAHQKGIIHRDLKPSNVLVAIQDEHPVPKIIDFGVAKATAQRLTEKTMYTEMGILIGTPEYMSPEQVEMTGLDVDTRTDVYALGVTLYEVLTGALPFEPEDLRKGGYQEIRRRIREVDPLRPSTRVKALGERSTDAAKNRQTDSGRLISRLKGDLDWIVMKALEKDRTRRYGSAAELAADVQRHLVDQPVLAGPPKALYRAGKFVRRHRFGVGAVAIAFVASVGFAATTAVQGARVARERDRANREAEVSRRVSEFMIGLFKVSDPSQVRGNTITAREILDKGAAEIAGELKEQADVKATLMDAMSRVYEALGLYDKAHPLAEEALALRRQTFGSEHMVVASSLRSLAGILDAKGGYAEAEALHRQGLAMQRKLRGNEHEAVALSLRGLAYNRYASGDHAEADSLYREALSMLRHLHGSDHEEVARCLMGLAIVLWAKDDYAGAEAVNREALGIQRRLLGNEHPEVASSLTNLGGVLFDKGDHAGAGLLYNEVLELQRKLRGNDHPFIATSLTNLANVHYSEGDYAGAAALYREALEMDRKLLGNEHPTVAEGLANLALALLAQGDHSGAEPLAREALDMRRKLLGTVHPALAWSLDTLGLVLSDKRDDKGAEALFREALEVNREVFGNDHSYVADNLTNLGWALYYQDRLADAEAAFRESLDIGRRVFRPDHPDIAASLIGLGDTLTEEGQAQQAEALLREALAILLKRPAEDILRVPVARSALGSCLTRLRKFDEAESLLLGSYSILQAQKPAGRLTQAARQHLFELYTAWGKPDKAAPYRVETADR